MTRPRSELVSLEATPFYHCISRCVRRSFLCGKDRYSGKDFDHRKSWVLERLALLSEVFAIDIAAYAIMSDHYHLVVHIDVQRANRWSDQEIVRRWTRLHKGSRLLQRFSAGKELLKSEHIHLAAEIRILRNKLCDISKFMSCLNFHIARRANLEDECTGHFWEGRFKSCALLEESALLSCMTYVDLNPVRAGQANGLDDSHFTSVQARIHDIRQRPIQAEHDESRRLPRLMPFSTTLGRNTLASLPYELKDYIELVDWTGRIARPDKRGHIKDDAPLMVEQLGLTTAQWQTLSEELQERSMSMLDGIDALERHYNRAA